MSFAVEVLYCKVDLYFYPILYPCVKKKKDFQIYLAVQF